MTDEPPAGPGRLLRAIELCHRFLAGEAGDSVEAFLQAHGDERELLEAMLEPADEAAAPEPAERVLGDFRIVRELGRGGMGVVYEAEQISLRRRVALKVLPAAHGLDPRAVARFQREARLAATLEHPGITRIHAIAEIDALQCFAMELVDGAPLDRVLVELAAIPPPSRRGQDLAAAIAGQCPGAHAAILAPDYVAAAVDLAIQIADALAHAHAAGVIHRDVKPANVLVRPDGSAVLTDFGIARAAGAVGLTRTGEFAGTPSYASPEQLGGSPAAIDARTDVFSLGASLYEMLTAQKPFDADTIAEIKIKIERVDPPSPSRANPSVPRDLAAIVLHALEKNPHQRYAGAQEFADDLRRFRAGRPVRARPVAVTTKLVRWTRRNPLAASLVAVLLGGTTAVSWLALEANAAVADFQSMRLGEAVRAVRARAARTFPAWPENETALAALAGETRALSARLPGQRARLARIAARGETWAEPPRDAGPHPAAARLAELERRLGLLDQRLGAEPDRPSSPAWRTHLESLRAALRAEGGELAARVHGWRRTCFANDDDQFLHDAIEEQLASLEDLAERLRPALRRRLAWARAVDGDTIDAQRGPWNETIARVAASAHYGALRLAPQRGLVPLGFDPDSGLVEFGHPRSGRVPIRDPDSGVLQLDGDSSLVLVLVPVPGGTTTVGAQRDDPGGVHYDGLTSGLESPPHEVPLAPFLVSKFELTHAQWNRLAAFAGVPDGPFEWAINDGFETKPVAKITWFDADRLCRAHGLGLPTEAQWEHACRAGSPTRWSTGDDAESLAGHANLADQHSMGAFEASDRLPFDDGHVGRAPAFAFRPNAFGLHQMHGNVWEWCADAKLEYPAPTRAIDGRRQGAAAAGAVRAFRGGDYKSGFATSRSAFRNFVHAAYRGDTLGLRPVRPLDSDRARLAEQQE